MGDRPIEEMGYLTPLEYAKTPNIDSLVKDAMTGLVHPYKAGCTCGTDWGHLSLFGYDPAEFYTGRGSIEAYSAGLKLEKGDLAFRGNLASVNDDLVVLDRRAGRINDKEDIEQLIEAINGITINNYTLIIKSLTEHRLAVVLRGNDLPDKIADIDPGTAKEGEKVVDPTLGNQDLAVKTYWELMLKVHEILNNHEVNKRRIKEGKLAANFILTRGSGKAMVVEPFKDKYKDAKVAIIAGDATINGIGEMCGFDSYSDDSFTGGFDTNYEGKAKLANELLNEYDLVIVHIKGTDLAGHDNLPFKKAEIISKIDEMFGYWIKENQNKDIYYAMIADHSTPCLRRDHSQEPVPAFIYGKDVRKDEVERFGERYVAKGIINQYTGSSFIATIMDYLLLSKKYGA